MRLSIVIPAYNHLDKVLRCVNSLQAFITGRGGNINPYFEIEQPEYIVQDDASPLYDLRALIPECVAQAYRNEINLGFNGNVNGAVKHTTGDILAICNQDIYAIDQWSTNWFKHIERAFDDPQVGIVGPRLLFPNGAIQSAAGEFDGKCQPSHRYLSYSDITYEPANTPEVVEWVTGAFLVVRRSLWEALGGFDPIYAPSYFEDVDLCLRARELGFKTWYEPRATFVHEVGSTGGSPHFGRSAAAFYERWVATGKVKPSVPVVRERFW